jgi:hypothetical protein
MMRSIGDVTGSLDIGKRSDTVVGNSGRASLQGGG